MCQQLGNNINNMGFDEIHEKWLNCFAYILKSFDVDFSYKSINSLFYFFEMDNWKTMHQENTEYKNYTKEELIDSFGNECHYISDRCTYDRLFRAHWLFRTAFNDEINKMLYPDFYK